MTNEQKAVYEAGATNAEIAAAGYMIYFSGDADQAAKERFNQSFNSLEIVNDSDITLILELDNLTTRKRKLFAKSTLVFNAEEGTYFNTLKVTNTSATTAIAAGELNMIARIVRFGAK